MENKQNWDRCLNLIKDDLTSQAFQTWFKSINCVGLTDNEITIEVPTRFHYEWLDSKYDKLIASNAVIMHKATPDNMIFTSFSIILFTIFYYT